MMNTPDNSFLSTLQRHEGGVVLDEMSEALADVVRGIMATGRGGSVTLKLDMAKAGRGGNAIVLTHEIKAKVPEDKTNGSFWFSDEAGHLCKEDPRQDTLRFTEEPVVVTGGKVDKAQDGQTSMAVNKVAKG